MNIGDPSKNPLGWEWGFKKKKNHFNVGRIQTQIVRVEVAHADHWTTTTTLQMFIFTLIRLNLKDLFK